MRKAIPVKQIERIRVSVVACSRRTFTGPLLARFWRRQWLAIEMRCQSTSESHTVGGVDSERVHHDRFRGCFGIASTNHGGR